MSLINGNHDVFWRDAIPWYDECHGCGHMGSMMLGEKMIGF